MKTTIYLVRHTQTIGNVQNRLVGRTDFEVTEKGEQYINQLVKRLEDIKFEATYSSVASRAIKTIKKLAEKNNCEIILSRSLCEMDFGLYDGLTWEEVEHINPNIVKIRDTDWVIKGIPEQESLEDVVERMDTYIRKIAEENLGKTILVASHGIAIECFLRNITGEYFSTKKIGYSQGYTALNILEYSNGEFEIKLKADISHIKEK